MNKSTRTGPPEAETPGRRGSDGAKAREAGVPLLAELGQGGEAGPARDAAGAAEESLKALGMERHQALIVSHRTSASAIASPSARRLLRTASM